MIIFTSFLTAMGQANTKTPKHGELNDAAHFMNLSIASNNEKLFASLTADSHATITLTPFNPPVKIAPSGGSFDYNIAVSNNDTTSLTFNVWTMATLPDGKLYGPIIQVQITLPAGWSGNGDLTLDVPEYAPPGNYTYHGYIGIYPNEVWDSDSFIFEKLSSGGWYTQYSDRHLPILLSVFFSDANNGWATGAGGILRTQNGGNDWYPQTLEVTSSNDVFFTDANNGWMVGGSGRIMHTTNGGDSWVTQRSGFPYSLYDVYFIDENTGWAVGGREASFQPAVRVITYTTDGGNNWNTQLYETNAWPLYSVYFIDANNGWAVGGTGTILHTTDGGNNWISQTSGNGNFLESVTFTDTNNGWIVGRNGIILHTTNSGDNWNPQTSETSVTLKSVHFVDSNSGWAVGGAGVVLHTTDAGNIWLPQESGTTNALASVYFVDDKSGWAAGLYGTIIHTTTGG